MRQATLFERLFSYLNGSLWGLICYFIFYIFQFMNRWDMDKDILFFISMIFILMGAAVNRLNIDKWAENLRASCVVGLIVFFVFIGKVIPGYTSGAERANISTMKADMYVINEMLVDYHKIHTTFPKDSFSLKKGLDSGSDPRYSVMKFARDIIDYRTYQNSTDKYNMRYHIIYRAELQNQKVISCKIMGTDRNGQLILYKKAPFYFSGEK